MRWTMKLCAAPVEMTAFWDEYGYTKSALVEVGSGGAGWLSCIAGLNTV